MGAALCFGLLRGGRERPAECLMERKDGIAIEPLAQPGGDAVRVAAEMIDLDDQIGGGRRLRGGQLGQIAALALGTGHRTAPDRAAAHVCPSISL